MITTETIARKTETRKAPSLCAKCGKPAGSISKGTGFPLVSDRNGNGGMVHVKCAARVQSATTVLAGGL